MKKTKILLLFVGILVQLFGVSSLAQTEKTAQQDTTKKSVKNRSSLELPDVLIYGEDRSRRLSGKKLDPFEDEPKIVAPPADYSPTIEPGDNQKFSFQSESEKSTSRKMVQLNYGKFQQLETSAGWWQETDNINFGLHGEYAQSNGQFENSQFALGRVRGQVAGFLADDLSIKTKGGYQYFDYGLYGANTNNLKRKNTGSNFNIIGAKSQVDKYSAELGLSIHNNNFEDRDSTNKSLDFSDSKFSLSAKFDTKYKATNISVNALYYYNNFKNKSFEISNSQSLLELNPEVTFFLRQSFVFRTGLIIHDVEIADLASETIVSPDIKIIYTPKQNLGFELKMNSGYKTKSYLDNWKNNPFITSQFNILPLKKRNELQFGVECRLASNIGFKSVLSRTDWKNYAFWSRDSLTGLFQLNNLNNVVLFSWNFLSELDLSDVIKFKTGLRLTIDSIKKDSASVDYSNVPYLERVAFPINFFFKIGETADAAINFDWVGPRKTSLTKKTELPGYGLLSFKVHKQMFENYSVFLAGQNLLDQKYELWENYPARGIYFEAGLRGNW